MEAPVKEEIKRLLDEERIENQEAADAVKRAEDQNRAAKQRDEAAM
ncbi:hypothetical protein [Limnoglobus roseus]|nr:hypothetical protein [Limnoglobus roseus]